VSERIASAERFGRAVQSLDEKPDTKRPVIIRAATSLFARRGVDTTSMGEIAEAASVREAAIYRYFASKDEMSREISTSWYGWYSRQLHEIVRGTRDKVHSVARLELSAAEEHTEAFTYFCENEPRFISSLPAGVPRSRDVFLEIIKNWTGSARGESGRWGGAGGHAERCSVRGHIVLDRAASTGRFEQPIVCNRGDVLGNDSGLMN
jgi:AcrR family transcriptional regulator